MKTNQIKKTSRFLAVELLEKVEKNQSFSNLLLSDTMETVLLSKEDRAFLTELVYGVIQNKRLLDYQLDPFIKKQKKMENWVRQLLRVSLYQMTKLDRVPVHAIVDEAVQIAKVRGHKGVSGLVNGVLRNINRKGVRSPEEIKDPAGRLAVTYSYPDWIIHLLKEEVGLEETEKIVRSLSSRSKVSLRVNQARLSKKEAIAALEAEGFEVVESSVAEDGLISQNGLPVRTDLFQQGLITIQDESSMLVSEAMRVEESDVILDACAAPGGKTVHMATQLNAEANGKIVALDLHKNKIKKIKENSDRLGVTDVVETKALDARKSKDSFDSETFDKILVDAPCSGLGLMRRKPDIRYQKSLEDIYSLQKVQLDILTSVAPLLKKGGRLIYSTCTITTKENDDVVKRFINENNEFEIEPVYVNNKELTLSDEGFLHLYPHLYGTDGFFIASLRKKQ